MKTFMPAKHLWAVACAAFALVFVFAATGLAQDFKIGFVDLQKFASKSVKAQAMQKKLMNLMNIMREQPSLETKKKELTALWERVQKEGPTLNEEAWNQILDEIRIKKKEVDKLEEAELERSHPLTFVPDTGRFLQDDFIKSAIARWYELDRGNTTYQRDLVKVVARIRAQKGLEIVFDHKAVLSADDSLDITDEVIEAYGEEPDSKATGPASAPRPKAPAEPSSSN